MSLFGSPVLKFRIPTAIGGGSFTGVSKQDLLDSITVSGGMPSLKDFVYCACTYLKQKCISVLLFFDVYCLLVLIDRRTHLLCNGVQKVAFFRAEVQNGAKVKMQMPGFCKTQRYN